MTEDEMVGWHHRLNGHGFGWTPGVGDGQGGLVCCNSWGRKESYTLCHYRVTQDDSSWVIPMLRELLTLRIEYQAPQAHAQRVPAQAAVAAAC